MFADPLQITYNAVVKDLPKVNQDNRSGEYYFDDGTIKFQISIDHTVPGTGQSNESHLIRLDASFYDGDGVFLRRVGAWLATKTYDGEQVTADSDYVVSALVGLLTAGNIDKLLGREN